MKRTAVGLSLASALLLLGVSARAEPLGASEVERNVLVHYPGMTAAEQERVIASADRLSAEGGFDPSIKGRASIIPFGPYPNERFDVTAELPTAIGGTRLFGGYRVGAGSFAVYDGKLETADYGEARAGLQIPLWRDRAIDRRRAAASRAELGLGVADANFDEQRLRLIRTAGLRYWDWVAAGRRVAIARSLLETAVARDAGLAERARRGDLATIERTENTRAIQQRETALHAAQRQLENATLELALFYRDENGKPLLPDASRLPPLPDTYDADVDSARAERTSLEQRPEPKRLALAKKQAELDRTLADNQRKPGFDLSFAVAQDFGPTNDPKLRKTELEAMVLFELPIMTRVQDGRVQAAGAQVARIDADATLAKDRILTEVRDAYSALQTARARGKAVRREVDVSRELVDLEKQRFELGEGTLLLVNIREQALAEAELREVDAMADFQRAIVNHRAATGLPR